MRRTLLLRAILIVGGALLLTVLLAQAPLFQRVDRWFGDAQQGVIASDARFENTVVVDIDEASLQLLQPYLGSWPFKRDIYALVLDYLAELGARKVCFDVLTSEERPGDAALSAAFGRNPHTVFAALALSLPRETDDARRRVLDRLSWSLPDTLAVDEWEDFSLPVIVETAPITNGVGIASLWPDADGVVRRIPLFHRAQATTLPALALALAVADGPRPVVDYLAGDQTLRVGAHVWPVDADGRVTLNFPRSASVVPSIPFHALALAAMGGAGAPFDHELLRGRAVIVGSTALQADSVNTPRGLFPGAYLLAVAHENLLGNRLLRAPDVAANAMLLSLSLIIPLLVSLRLRLTTAGIVASLLFGMTLAYLANLGLLAFWQRQSQLLVALTVLSFNAAGQFALLAVGEYRRRQHAEHQMRIAAAVYQSSKEGIFVTDADNRIVSANPAFTEITGYNEAEVVGRNPRLLSSNRHDADFYRAMWRSIVEKGSWQGEIWNRRKNGEVFPEWLAVNTVKGETGEVERRIAVLTDLSGDKAAEERISFLAHYDPLTGLPNRTLFQDRVDVALAAAQRARGKVILMLIDLDRFKTIVDSLGHEVGDQMLQEVARRLCSRLGDGDTASRYGGDEFMLLLPDSDAERATHLAKDLLQTIAMPYNIAEHELSLTASIGIAEYPEDGQDHNGLARSADSALNRAKQSGRGNFQFFTAEMHRRAHELLVLENSLRHAVERNELVLHYQPKVDAASSRLLGLEALVRWQHPERGLVPPVEFIPLAEESGLIREIGDWVLHAALSQMSAWRSEGLILVPVAVNLSAVQFSQANLCERLAIALRQSEIPANMLELELTESVAMENSQYSVASIDSIRELGIGLSIDDFGTGYSSLSYLKRFAVNKIKIDHSFIHNLVDDKEDASIVRAIISLAHNLGFTVVAEGVETAEQLAFLRRHGCDEIQGFYFCRPQPAAAITGLLRGGVVVPMIG